MDIIERFEQMLSRGKDSPLLRYSLGLEYAKRGQSDEAIAHLDEAVRSDPGYSAAWKAYGLALAAAGRSVEAARAYRSGIDAAQHKGDVQAAKEMRVFLKRVEKGKSA